MKQQEIKLIDSTYGVQEAKEILMALINSKISFIDHQIFACGDCYGADPTHLKMRKLALTKEKEQLLQTLNAYKRGDHQVEIDCAVSLKIKALTPA